MHSLIVFWFDAVRDWGYLGIVLLMAMESSIIPLPSELVIPPAAYWAAQGRYTVWGVVLAGTVGSYLGAAVMYWAARGIGRLLILRYGKYIWIPEGKVLKAERWLQRYEAGGVFFARLFPVIRHLIGIPAGIVRMNFKVYSVVTIAGSGLWCGVLAWFGVQVIGDQPNLLNDPDQMIHVVQQRSIWFLALIVLICVMYFAFLKMTAKPSEP